MDRDTQHLTALLLDPFLTTGEAAQEAEALATVRHPNEDHVPGRPKDSRSVARPAAVAAADYAAY